MTTARRYLGLDLGTSTGFALVEGNRLLLSGVRNFAIKSHETNGHRGIAFYNFLRKIGPVDEIYYEKIMFTGKFNCSDGHELYNGLKMVMNMVAASLNIPTFGVWPGTLKKDFTGSGSADKEAMCAHAHALGWKGGTAGTADKNDEADAIALVVTQLRQRYNLSLRF